MAGCTSVALDAPPTPGNSDMYLVGKFHAHTYMSQGVLGHVKSEFPIHFYVFCNFQMAVSP